MNTGKHFRVRLGGGCAIIVLVVLAVLMNGCGTKEPEVFRIGVLSGLEFVADVTDGFKDGMAELGYVEGENIVYDVQRMNFDIAGYQSALHKFVDDEVDLILAFPTEASIEAKAIAAGTGIPVVFSYALIEGMGLVDSVREPGGNITGVRYPGPDIALKRYEILMEMAPQAKRLLIPYQRGYPIVAPQLEALQSAVEAAGVTIIEAPADNVAEVETILAERSALDDIGVDAILFLAEPLTATPGNFAPIGKFAYEHGVPVGGVLLSEEGYETLFGVNALGYDSGKKAAPLADKILKGTAAGTLPVVSSDHYVQINYRAAQAMGLNVPDSLLSMADEIIR